MKLKRFTGKTEFDAMEAVRKELGDEAIIMNTKKVKPKGFFGFLKKHEYELLVGIEEEKPEPVVKQDEFQALLKDNLDTKRELQDIKDYIRKMNEYLEERDRKEQERQEKAEKESKEKQVGNSEAPKQKRAMQKEESLRRQKDSDSEGFDRLEDVEELIEEDFEDLDLEAEGELAERKQDPKAKIKELAIYKKLILKGVNEDLAGDLCELIMRQAGQKDANEEQINRLAKIAIKNMLGNPYQIPKEKGKQSIFFFVGPTGVGKTTTIAKIATKLSFIEGRDLALITTDTFRIAAVEQLKVYGDILNLPISVVYKPIEFKEILHKYKDKEIILIDTAGKSHLDEGMESYIDSYLECAPDSEKFLLISLTTSYRDIESIVKSYGFMDDYKLIFTKIDEASLPGNILNIKHKTGRNTSFITNGQSVPDDIIVADPDEIAKIILGD